MKVTWTNNGKISIKGITNSPVHNELLMDVFKYITENKAVKSVPPITQNDIDRKLRYASAQELSRKLAAKATQSVSSLLISPSEALFVLGAMEFSAFPSVISLRMELHRLITSWR